MTSHFAYVKLRITRGIFAIPLDFEKVRLTCMFLGPKIARPGGHMFNKGLYREKHEKIFLSETIRPRALIFGK